MFCSNSEANGYTWKNQEHVKSRPCILCSSAQSLLVCVYFSKNKSKKRALELRFKSDLGRLCRIVLCELHGQREVATIPVSLWLARDETLPFQKIDAPATHYIDACFIDCIGRRKRCKRKGRRWYVCENHRWVDAFATIPKNTTMSAAHLELNLCREIATRTCHKLPSCISCFAIPMSRLSSAIGWRHSSCRLWPNHAYGGNCTVFQNSPVDCTLAQWRQFN